MDIERKNLEILFKEIPYSYIGLRRLPIITPVGY